MALFVHVCDVLAYDYQELHAKLSRRFDRIVLCAYGDFYVPPAPEKGPKRLLRPEVYFRAWAAVAAGLGWEVYSQEAHLDMEARNLVFATDILESPACRAAGVLVVHDEGHDKEQIAWALGGCQTFVFLPSAPQSPRARCIFDEVVEAAGDGAFLPGSLLRGDLLETSAPAIVHQCNCTTNYACGLAEAIFQRYPEANEYVGRKQPSELGSASVVTTADGKRVANLFAQFHGGSAADGGKQDSPDMRLEAFERSLTTALETMDRASVRKCFAAPLSIGCGRGGGDWAKYFGIVHSVAERAGWSFLLLALTDEEEFVCSLCASAVPQRAAREHLGVDLQVCRGCVNRCLRCKDPDGLLQPDASWLLPDMTVELPNGSTRRLLFRASFQTMEEEALCGVDEAIPSRSTSCTVGGRCQGTSASAHNSAYLHVFHAHNWSRKSVERDRQMSCSTWCSIAAPRVLSSCERRQEAAKKMQASSEEDERLFWQARLQEARELQRDLLHFVAVPLGPLPGLCVDLSSPARRAECCRVLGQLCSGCLSRGVVDYGATWGDELKEVILDRASLGGLHVASLRYESEDFQFFMTLLDQANGRGQCNDCRIEVERNCRQHVELAFQGIWRVLDPSVLDEASVKRRRLADKKADVYSVVAEASEVTGGARAVPAAPRPCAREADVDA